MGQFVDIRPYNDQELAGVLTRLLEDPEFINAMARQRFGAWHKYLGFLLNPLVKKKLLSQVGGVKTVRDFQLVVKYYLEQLVENTTDGVDLNWSKSLEDNKAYLFLSNHRDIVLDPALVNYSLFMIDHDTVRIAIGDNLLSKPFVSDLMRLNKSFIVKRSAKGPREMLAAYKQLSAYIKHSIQEDNNSVWLAQREGRAKDGIDKTEPAIIKMLSMSMDRKKDDFNAYIHGLNIVPVVISYEYDPCDAMKAKELYEKAVNGSYEKEEGEDNKSIAQGFSGQKGKIYLYYGEPLSGYFETPEAVAESVDQQIINNYFLHPTNFYAYKRLTGSMPEDLQADGLSAEGEKIFNQRIDAMPEAHRPYALGIYANIIRRKLGELDD